MTTLVLFVVGCLFVLAVGAFAAGHLLAGAGLAIVGLFLFDRVRPTVMGEPRHRD